ncbi:hypothetical protein PR048_023555 [Dryococelus australis]|uniref:Transposase n=1 Tax=Dryococelus australis TaxID=614101 RepID=A0ABQ9GUI3_9NEOP|nr:hypothetical protein PR048_023555 [Dryococelus australis]
MQGKQWNCTFVRPYERLRDESSAIVTRGNAGTSRTRQTAAFDEDVLRRVRQEQSVSSRAVRRGVGVRHSTILQILKNVRPNFASTVLFTDEVHFARDDILNKRNSHIWAHANPLYTQPMGNQLCYSVNKWAGIANNLMSGPYLLPRPSQWSPLPDVPA